MKKRSEKDKSSRVSEIAPVVLGPIEGELYSAIRAILARARETVYRASNTAMVEAYWNVGREIVEKQGGKRHAKYGDALVKTLAIRLTADFGAGFTAANLLRVSRELTAEFGKGFAEPQLRNCRLFYVAYPNEKAIRYALRIKLSWTHHRAIGRRCRCTMVVR